ncbi:MAG: hypothetical protein M0T70_07305 [Geobacteraceae bacterium]|nr:hypothetical protein [Geobacteraceae bacterium]
MESTYLYEEKDYQTKVITLAPQTFNACGSLFGNYRNASIFPVPFDNTVGSNDMGNAITLISFHKGKVAFERHFRNADDITGSGKYLPSISADLIGFGQVRVFHLFDFKKKLHREYEIEFPITKYIERIAIANAPQRRFIFEIESQKANPKNSFDVGKTLQLIDLSGDKRQLVKELHKDPGTIWTTTKDRVILWEFDEKKMQVFDMNLEPAHHPLETVVNRYKSTIDFSRIYIHPYLPIAILRGGKGTVYVSWGKDKDSTPHLLLSSASQFEFSPDGKWVLFKHYFGSSIYQTYIMPVSEKLPHYFGFPILISDKSFEPGHSAWTTKPTGFVGSYLDKIFRWDLENQDFPEKGKMSFHDYVVQKDLEKLTREKRQGLGEKHK